MRRAEIAAVRFQSFYRAEADGSANGPPTARAPSCRTRSDTSLVAPTGPAYTGPQFLPPTPPRRKWPLLVAWAAVVLLAAGLGVRYWMQINLTEPITLAVVEHDGQLQVQWNNAAKLVRDAMRGSLEISDGGETKTIVPCRDRCLRREISRWCARAATWKFT